MEEDERAYGYMHNENKQIVINPIKIQDYCPYFKCMLLDISSFNIRDIEY